LKYKFLDKQIDYNGTQLQSRFAYMNHEILGDSIIAFVGACDIPFEHMVDGEDVLAKSPICGSKMLHFIIEEFSQSLELAVTRQRLFASIARDEIEKLNSEKKLTRDGDDLFLNDKKISISIATVSPVSAVIHFAMNISNAGTPVKTLSLEDLGLNTQTVADVIGARFIDEIRTIKEACCKVNWVK